ncbi:hypothetical protein WMF39_40270 [Sorangium sp. So ce1504]|uniref:hypothetical protein n=1 Tax=Sorangium sp. So ce1504 TaxID=3133337 RepID=UPI003F6037C3
MARSRTVQQSTARPARGEAKPLGPGLHPGVVEMIVARGEESDARPAFQVRSSDGRRLLATLAAGVSPAFIEECMREGRTVVLADAHGGVAILGALQTASAPAPDAHGTLALDARHLRLRARETLELEVPGSSLRIEPGGAVRIEGDRLVIDMAALVRIFSARVELP